MNEGYVCVRCGIKQAEETTCYKCNQVMRYTDKLELYDDLVLVVFKTYGKISTIY